MVRRIWSPGTTGRRNLALLMLVNIASFSPGLSLGADSAGRALKPAAPIPVPPLGDYALFALEAEAKEMSTTMAAVRLFSGLLKDKALGPRLVPIVADEARTFGMASLFRQIGIYSSKGQLYEPVDSETLHLRFCFIQRKGMNETQQRMAKALLDEMSQQHPQIRANMLAALVQSQPRAAGHTDPALQSLLKSPGGRQLARRGSIPCCSASARNSARMALTYFSGSRSPVRPSTGVAAPMTPP